MSRPGPGTAPDARPDAVRHPRPYDRSLPIALLRAREATMRLFKPHLDAEGLSLPQWRVVRALAEAGALDAGTLAERCAVLAPSLTRILDALEARGLAEPAPAGGDQRRRVVRLTPAGRQLFAAMVPESQRVYRALEAEFGSDRLETLVTLLADLRTAAESIAAREAGRRPRPRQALR